MGNKLVSCKRSQVTIFIIVGIVIVAVIIGFFLLYYKIRTTPQTVSVEEPEQYIAKCARDAAAEAASIMLPQGGHINPLNYKLYEDNKVAYLCHTNLFYTKCISQEPMYIEHIQNEITDYITPKIEQCFSDLNSELESRGYEIGMNEMKVETKLSTNTIKINIKREYSIAKNEETQRFAGFKSALNSPLYNLAIVAQEIANQEAKFCYFEYVGFMILYPDFKIEKKSISQGASASKIYIIEDKYTGKKLNIAVRSCAVPAGL